MESCWRNLGGRAVEWIDPVDEEKWFDEDKDNRRAKNIEVIDIRGSFHFSLYNGAGFDGRGVGRGEGAWYIIRRGERLLPTSLVAILYRRYYFSYRLTASVLQPPDERWSCADSARYYRRSRFPGAFWSSAIERRRTAWTAKRSRLGEI